MARHRRPTQLDLALQEKCDWGGKRTGAGRPRSRTGVAHVKRERHKARHPVHVTMRVLPAVGSLRADKPFAVVRKALKLAQKDDFRIIEFSVQSNHLHLIVESEDERTLARGMQGLATRIARRLNKLLHRKGQVFSDRYHRIDLTSARQTRNAIAYVLQNHRKHKHEAGEQCRRGWRDPCSSSRWFDGWDVESPPASPRGERAPVVKATTWLLTTGWWEHYPLISPDEVPGSKRASAAKRARRDRSDRR